MITMMHPRVLNIKFFMIGTEVVHFILNDEWISCVTKLRKRNGSNTTLQKKIFTHASLFAHYVYRRTAVCLFDAYFTPVINQCVRPRPRRETDTARRWGRWYLCTGSRFLPILSRPFPGLMHRTHECIGIMVVAPCRRRCIARIHAMQVWIIWYIRWINPCARTDA